MNDSQAHWDSLHANARFRPVYPNDHVVRFLMGFRARKNAATQMRLLDIGAGAGRHTKLAAELGFKPFGIDLSSTGLQHARLRLQDSRLPHDFAQASMLALPFRDASFDAVVSFGVFYYGCAEQMKKAIAETHRVLTPAGEIFAVLRTVNDYRFGKGKELERNTTQLNIEDTNEYETIQHFVDAGDVPLYFAEFRQVSFEKTETTFANRRGVNSDWLVSAEK
jgi:ubiquinone/menaquinone biosynthesis C-methylase UbiE